MRHLTAKHAWVAILLFVVLWNTTCVEGGTLSEQYDKWIEAHPILARIPIIVVAGHVANLINPEVDPIHLAFVGAARLRTNLLRRF